MWYIITGNAFIKPVIREVKNKQYVDNQTGVIKQSKIDMIPVSPFNVYYSPNVFSIDQSPYAFETFLMDKKIFKELYGFEDTSTLKYEDTLKYRILLTGGYYNLNTNINLDDYIEIYIYYQPPNAIDPDGKYVVFTENNILELKEEYPFPEDCGIPLSQAKRIETGFAIGETPITYSVASDIEFNLSRGQLSEHAEKLASPIMILPLGSNIKAEDIGNRKVKVIRFNTKYGTPQYLQPSEFPQFFYQNLQEIKEDLMDINAIHPPSMGKKQSGVRSGLQYAYMIDVDDQHFQPDIAQFYLMFEQAGRKYLSLIRENYDNKEYISLWGRDNAKYFKYSGKQLKKDINIEIEVLTGLPLNRIARQQMLMQLFVAGLIQRNHFLQLIEMGELDKVYKRNFKDRIRQELELDKIISGDTDEVKVSKYDNHIEHIKTIIEFTKTARYHDLDEDTKKLIDLHIDQHNEMIVMLIKESPVASNYILDMNNLDDLDRQAIAQELMRQTAINQGSVTPPESGKYEFQQGQQQQSIQNKAQAAGVMPPDISNLMGG